MSAKKCSYKGCGSFTNSSHPSSETFYSFPKHPERLKIWMKLGGILNEEELTHGCRYFCSKHFDEYKYVANNPRRKQLISTAVPYPCMETTPINDLTGNDENEYQCVESSEHPIVGDCESKVIIKMRDQEVVANEISSISESIETLENYDEDCQNEVMCPTDFEEALEFEKKPIKRKLDHATVKQPVLTAVPSKRRITIVSNHPTSTINTFPQHQIEENGTFEECDLLNTLPESNNITTFIFKGQEYVQMPKDEYNREKMALLNKIRNYEHVLKNVKHFMDNVKI